MKLLFLALALILSVSCGTAKKSKPSPTSIKIAKFVEEYSAQYVTVTPESQSYVDSYTEYLNEVYTIYMKAGEGPGFDTYLNSLRNNNQIVADAKFNLPQRYKRETKRRADPRSRDYQTYQTKIITGLNDRLNEERLEKLRQSIDAKLFEQLVETNEKYKAKNDTNIFPL